METGPAHVRPGRTDDAADLARLCSELGYPSTEAQIRARLRLMSDPERELLVADAGDGLAGFVDIHVQRVVEADPYGEVGGLVVAEAHRAQGLGRSLLDAAAAWCRERDLAEMWIRANLARVGAHDFYEAVGCRTVKDQRVYAYPL